MPTEIFTSSIHTGDSDRLDISIAGNARVSHREIGRVFAPSSRILHPFLMRRKSGNLTRPEWLCFARDYTTEMRKSYKDHQRAWRLLLSWQRTVLVCSCSYVEHCHRTILASVILPKLGAHFNGEIQ